MTFGTKMGDNKDIHEESGGGGGNGTNGDGQSPGHAFAQLFQSMHDLSDKLLALDYHKEFVRQYKCPPISRYYFCRQTNAGQQLYTLAALSAYLLHKLSPNVNINVDDFDDPMATINTIIQSAKEFIDITVYYNNANKLRLGYGHECIDLLNDLANKVMETNDKFNDRANEIVVNGCDDFNDENISEELAADEMNATDLLEEDYDYNLSGDKQEIIEEELPDTSSGRATDTLDTSIMRSDMDLNEWKTEVERVLPQLKVRVGGGGDHKSTDNEWRTHYNSLAANYRQMRTHCEQTYGSIETLLHELRQNEEKITSREKYLRQQLEDIIDEFVSIRGKVGKLRDDYSLVSAGVVTKSAQLAEVSAVIDGMKQEMELYGNQMTDSSPLIVAKRAKEVLKEELNSIELRIGVAVQTLIVNNKH